MKQKSGGAVLWYSLRPFVIYLIVFAVVSTALNALFGYLLSEGYAANNAGMLYGIFYAAVYAAGLISVLHPARTEIHYYEGQPSRAFGVRQERALYTILFVSALCLALFLNILLNYTGIVQADDSMQAAGNIEALMGLPLCAAVFGILAPLTEECVFRAALFGRLERGFGPIPALILSAALFAVYHGNLPQMIYAFCMGLVFAGSYHLAHRFLLPYMLHACTNILVMVLSFTGIFERICTPAWMLAFGALFVIGGMSLFRALRDHEK